MYVPLSSNPFLFKRNNIPTLTTTKKVYTSLHEYAFDSNHIWTPLIGPKKSFPWVRIWLKPHMHDFKWTYTQPSTFKNTPKESNTHARGITHTDIYVQTQKQFVTDSKLMFFSIQHQLSNIHDSTDNKHNPNPRCWTYAHQKILTLTPTLTKNKQ